MTPRRNPERINPPFAAAPQVKPSLLKIEVGVKTRQQLTSERAILQMMIAAAVGACGDERLSEKAKPFSRGLCRHFAMLYAAGAAPPPAPPATSRPPPDPTAPPRPADQVRGAAPRHAPARCARRPRRAWPTERPVFRALGLLAPQTL